MSMSLETLIGLVGLILIWFGIVTWFCGLTFFCTICIILGIVLGGISIIFMGP